MACPVSFATMWQNYPTEDHDALFKALGWDSLIDNANYTNTCAIRMSVCLLRSGVSVGGNDLLIQKGPLKGKGVKTRFNELANYLAVHWGAPEKFPSVKADDVKGRQGVIAYFKLPGGYPGHIDLINAQGEPGHATYFGSQEGWFWPAK